MKMRDYAAIMTAGFTALLVTDLALLCTRMDVIQIFFLAAFMAGLSAAVFNIAASLIEEKHRKPHRKKRTLDWVMIDVKTGNEYRIY